MTVYDAPTRDMRFVMHDLGLLDRVQALPGCEEPNGELVDAVLEEAGKLAGEALAPLNASGDRQGATLENGVVRVADGFAEVYHAYVEGGWNSIPFDPADGGQGLPWLVGVATEEMWISANNAWALCPMLTLGAADLLAEHGTPEQKATYLEKLVTGEWTGTMNLTEPQAGSDVGALRCRAEPAGDHYRLRGQKIFITWGEHDMTDNIVHMVLARTPGAPAGPGDAAAESGEAAGSLQAGGAPALSPAPRTWASVARSSSGRRGLARRARTREASVEASGDVPARPAMRTIRVEAMAWSAWMMPARA